MKTSTNSVAQSVGEYILLSFIGLAALQAIILLMWTFMSIIMDGDSVPEPWLIYNVIDW